MPSWRRVFTSEEAFVESKAGACPPEEKAFANTDRELYRDGGGDGNGMSYYEPSLHVTQDGLIGINVGGHVFVRSLTDWHALAKRDWPMPSPPPWPADDEDDEAPDE